MRYYLGSFIGTGREGDPFRPALTDPYTLLDLRGDSTQPAGRCLVAVDQALALIPAGWRDLGDDLDARSTTRRDRLGNDLGLTLGNDSLRGAIAELLIVHGRPPHDTSRWNPLQEYRGRHQILMGLETIYDAPAPRGTTITDNFTRADAGSLGSSSEGWSWTAVVGTFSIVSNTGRKNSNANAFGYARAESDLATEHHYAQATVGTVASNNTRVGVAVRFNPSASTFYHHTIAQNLAAVIAKVITGGVTNLVSWTAGVGDTTMRLLVRGSALQAFHSTTVLVKTATDTAITGFLRTGICGVSENGDNRATWDDFTATDLPPASLPPRRRPMAGLISR